MAPSTTVATDAPMMLMRRPMKSAHRAPSAQPAGDAIASTRVYSNERVMVRPCCTKNCGSQVTKPKIKVLTVISTQLPTIMRNSNGGRASAARFGRAGTAPHGTTAGNAVAAPFSIAAIMASASSLRPWDSSQRGDSGRFLRSHQTISAPTPAMTNIGRQPQAGMIR